MAKRQKSKKHTKQLPWAVCARMFFVLFFVSFAHFLAPTLLAPVPQAQLQAQEGQRYRQRGKSIPNSVVVERQDFVDWLKNVNPAESTKSSLYPKFLDEKIRPIAESKVPEVQDLARWAGRMLDIFAVLCWYGDRNEDRASGKMDVRENYAICQACIERLEQETIDLAAYRKNWSFKPGAAGHSSDEYVPTNVVLEEIQFALERRGMFWRQALAAATGPNFPVTKHFSKTVEELRQLTAQTLEVESYFLDEKTRSASGETIGKLWCDYLDTKSFIVELEATLRSLDRSTRLVSLTYPIIPIPMLVSFSDRANVVLHRLNDKELSKAQIAYLDVPAVKKWKEELAKWTADTVPIEVFLREVEAYESNAGMSDMSRLFRLTTRLSFSHTDNFRRLGLMGHEIYGGSNVKLYISKVLVNHLLPPSEPEVASFREYIQKQPVVGRRKTDLDINMNFQPDPTRLRLSLDVQGNVSTSSRASAFATTLFNRGQARFVARKDIELTAEGFQPSPCQVQVKSNRLTLQNFRTEFDGIPILSGVVRGVVQNQYEARQGGAREETRRKIVQQVRERVDKEADDRFGTFNEQLKDFMSTSMHDFGLFLEKNNASTEEHWLLTSWAIKSQDSLSGNTPAPETLPGAFADFKVHESALNAFLGKLDIAGQTSTIGELKTMLAERLRRPEIAEPDENDNTRIGFAEYNPLIVRFSDGRIELSISIKSLRIGRKTHRDFQVHVIYRPVLTPEGKLVLQRDSIIELKNTQAQFILRAVFGKIFPAERRISLTPKMLDENPQFAGLTTGQCRVEKGWFAIALIADASVFRTRNGKTLISDQLPHGRARR